MVVSTKEPKQSSSRDAKRARFSGQTKQKAGGPSSLVLIVGLLVVVALVGGAIFAVTRPTPVQSKAPADTPSAPLGASRTGSQGLLVQAATEGHDPYPLVEAKDGAVSFPLSTFDDYKAHFYTYMQDGRPIEFFVLKSKDGVVRAAFNACDVCFPAKKGYHQEGDEMICNNCGRRFPADQINEVQGGCNPSPLQRETVGDALVIQVQDIVRGSDYF
jgi:Membrane iron-sulfur containing protein FtrD-like